MVTVTLVNFRRLMSSVTVKPPMTGHADDLPSGYPLFHAVSLYKVTHVPVQLLAFSDVLKLQFRICLICIVQDQCPDAKELLPLAADGFYVKNTV